MAIGERNKGVVMHALLNAIATLALATTAVTLLALLLGATRLR
jgi:hypothetical protein